MNNHRTPTVLRALFPLLAAACPTMPAHAAVAVIEAGADSRTEVGIDGRSRTLFRYFWQACCRSREWRGGERSTRSTVSRQIIRKGAAASRGVAERCMRQRRGAGSS
jgi:hypothetical protein